MIVWDAISLGPWVFCDFPLETVMAPAMSLSSCCSLLSRSTSNKLVLTRVHAISTSGWKHTKNFYTPLKKRIRISVIIYCIIQGLKAPVRINVHALSVRCTIAAVTLWYKNSKCPEFILDWKGGNARGTTVSASVSAEEHGQGLIIIPFWGTTLMQGFVILWQEE